MSTLPIETERLRIRLLTADDWQAVHAYTSDPGVMTYLPEEVMTEEQTRQFVATSMTEEAQTYAVDFRVEDRLIGHIGFHPWYAPRIYEIGWVFHPRYQGQGYATEAAAAWLAHGFTALGLPRVISVTDVPNARSIAVMRRLGMLRDHEADLDDGDDRFRAVVHAITADQWRDHRHDHRQD